MNTLPQIRRPALGVPSLDAAGDSVSYFSRLVHTAIVDEVGEVAVLQLLTPGSPPTVSAEQAERYAERMVRAQLVSAPDWWLFTHLAPARTTRKLPSDVRRPYAVFVHGAEVLRETLGPGRREVLQDATARFAASAFAAQRVMELHSALGHVDACPIGLLPDDDIGAIAAVGEPPLGVNGPAISAHSVLHHATLDAEGTTALQNILTAWTDVGAHIPDAQLVITSDECDVEQVAALAGAYSGAGAVVSAGCPSAGALTELRRGTCLFVASPSADGLPWPVLEAMRSALPVMAPSDDAAADMVAPRETGLLYDPATAGGIAASIIELLENADMRTRFGSATAERYRSLYTYDAFRRRFIGIAATHFPAS
jgi:hypothetical protein